MIAREIANGAKAIIKCLVPQTEYGKIQLAEKASITGTKVKIKSKATFLFSILVAVSQAAKYKAKAIMPTIRIGSVIRKIVGVSILLCSK